MSDGFSPPGGSLVDAKVTTGPTFSDGLFTSSLSAGVDGADGVDGAPRSPLADEVQRLRADLAAARVKIENLEIALRSSRQIGAAVGILMAQRRISQDAAFDLLRLASQQRHRKLREIADEILYTGVLEPAQGRHTSAAQPTGCQRPHPPVRRPVGPHDLEAPVTAECSLGDGSDLGRLDAKGSAGQPAPAERANGRRSPSAVQAAVTQITRADGAHPADETAPTQVSVATDRDGERVVLTVTGDLDLATSRLLTEIGVPATHVPGCRTVEMDLSAVTFLDAAGLSALNALRIDAARQGRRFQITRRSRRVHRLLTLAGLDDRLEDAARPPERS